MAETDGRCCLEKDKQIATYVALMLVVLFWGLSFVATKIALETFTIFTLVFIRFFLAAIFFSLMMVKTGFPKFSRQDHFKVLLTAFFEPGLYFIFETIGLQHTSAPKAALIIATVPVAVLVFAALFLREKPASANIGGIALSLLGITILVTGDPKFSWDMKGSLMGDLLIMGAVLSAAAYTVCARDLGRKHTALDITSLQMIYGAVMYTPAFLWELPGVQWSAISGRSLASLVYLTLCATFLAFLFYNYALTRIAAGRAAVFINGIPVITAVAAWILLGEVLTLLQVGGGVLVLTAVFLANVGRFRVKRKPVALPGEIA